MATSEEIDELIRGSGNNFHAKVARWFSKNGWHVVVSPYYMDQSQNKAREIDLIAEKSYPVRDEFGRGGEFVAVRLFIECKFVPSLSVFWFADKDRGSSEELVCTSAPFRKGNSYTNKHHYLSQSPRVAKLFSTATNKASENEPFYKALNQALNALVSMRGQPMSIPSLKKRSPTAVLEFPVVVCSSFEQIYSVDFDTDSKANPVVDNFQLEVRYAYVDRNGHRKDDYFLLDFVDFNQLEKFTNSIDEDAKSAAELSGN